MTSEKLSDEQVYGRLHAALLALGANDGETMRGDTTVKAARRVLLLLQMGLLKAQEDEADRNEAIKAPSD